MRKVADMLNIKNWLRKFLHKALKCITAITVVMETSAAY